MRHAGPSRKIYFTVMESQINIRDNAMHAQAILDDLLKWQKEQKKKDDALREQARSDAAAPSQAPAPMPPASPVGGRCVLFTWLQEDRSLDHLAKSCATILK